MGYDRRENVKRLNAFVTTYALVLGHLAQAAEGEGQDGEAAAYRERADAVRSLSVPDLPFLR